MKWFFLLSCVFVGTQASGCPFSQSYNEGLQRAYVVSNTKAQLIKNKYVIAVGEPAFSIWTGFPLDDSMVAIYNKTNALLLAQQFFLDANMAQRNMSNDMKLQYLKTFGASVPLADRCLPVPVCNQRARYREITGKCNNIGNPKWGSAYSPYNRMQSANYDDGIYTIRRSVTNDILPSPRLIGNELLQDSSYVFIPNRMVNHGSLIFGQYITHDSAWREVYQNDAGGDAFRCCSKDYQHMLPDYLSYYGCYSIDVPRNDPFYSKFNMGCLSYTRSQPIFPNDCQLGPAELANSVTSYIDQSTIYGSHEAAAKSVRSFQSGQLLIDNNIMARTPNCTGPYCYFTGDNRGSFYSTLSVWHSIFIRYHNLIAKKLAALNKHWTDDRLFQETRRICTAVYQNIVFNEWLPYYIGEDTARKRHISCDPWSTYCGAYDPTVDSSNTNEFSHGAFRLFHVNTPQNVSFYDAAYNQIKTEPLFMHTNGANVLEQDADNIMRGLLWDPIYFGKYPDDLRNTVFNNDNVDGIGLDTLSVDIARGRDHGLQPYHVYLSLSSKGERIINDWDDLADVFLNISISKLKKVYNSVHDIDLFVGLLLETKHGDYAGPVTRWIMEEQFYRFKYGDRFYYSFANSANPFTEAQIREINSQRFANVVCSSSALSIIPQKAMEKPSFKNRMVDCRSLKRLNLNLWQSAT